jgi:hypothetical protein
MLTITRASGRGADIRMQEECTYEILEARFDGESTDEQRLEFARIVNDHPEMVESLVAETFIHSLLQWVSERTSLD